MKEQVILCFYSIDSKILIFLVEITSKFFTLLNNNVVNRDGVLSCIQQDSYHMDSLVLFLFH